jgi:putative phosphoserine phosphatase/1-acylglycerol-3-phosphate O-acyltransferase
MTMTRHNGAHPQHPQPGRPTAEVDASPQGPQVGAFFDLDGTLVPGYTAAAHTRDRLRHRDLRVVEFLTVVQLAAQFRLGRRTFETLIEGSARTVKGRLARDVDEAGERIFRESVADQIYPEMRELVQAHQRRGHTVVLSSSALTNQVVPVARYLGIDHVICNRLVADDQGKLTGELEQPVVWGPTKASSVQQFAVGHHVELSASYFYADGDEDISLMRQVGHPRPTNPGPLLARVAIQRGWPVLRFTSRGGGGALATGRRLASLSSLGPLAVAALFVGLLRRNRRAGVNVLTRFWPGTVLALSGVKLNVTGAEHLTERRPAVFLFNVRSSADVFLVAALIKDNWTGMVTKELQASHVFGQLGKLLDVAFVDRADPGMANAIRSLQVAARKGLSILVPPEGTRPGIRPGTEPGNRSVGPFKRRAFLIAMATGLPIVPIVIRNSESVAGRHATRLSPGTVDIAVLPPVSVENWTLLNLRQRIEQVRMAYLKTLAEWPGTEEAEEAAEEAEEPDGRAGTS